MSIEDLPLEVIEVALLDYEYNDLLHLCSQTTGENLTMVCKLPQFWLNKLEHDLITKRTTPQALYIESVVKNYNIYKNLLIEIYNIDPSLNKYELLKWIMLNRDIGALKSLLFDPDIVRFIDILLHEIIYQNYTKGVKLIYDAGYHFSYPDNEIIIDAAKRGQSDITKYLLQMRISQKPIKDFIIRYTIQNYISYKGNLSQYVKTMKILLSDPRIKLSEFSSLDLSLGLPYGTIIPEIAELILYDPRARERLTKEQFQKYEEILLGAPRSDLIYVPQQVYVVRKIPLNDDPEKILSYETEEKIITFVFDSTFRILGKINRNIENVRAIIIRKEYSEYGALKIIQRREFRYGLIELRELSSELSKSDKRLQIKIAKKILDNIIGNNRASEVGQWMIEEIPLDVYNKVIKNYTITSAKMKTALNDIGIIVNKPDYNSESDDDETISMSTSADRKSEISTDKRSHRKGPRINYHNEPKTNDQYDPRRSENSDINRLITNLGRNEYEAQVKLLSEVSYDTLTNQEMQNLIKFIINTDHLSLLEIIINKGYLSQVVNSLINMAGVRKTFAWLIDNYPEVKNSPYLVENILRSGSNWIAKYGLLSELLARNANYDYNDLVQKGLIDRHTNDPQRRMVNNLFEDDV